MSNLSTQALKDLVTLLQQSSTNLSTELNKARLELQLIDFWLKYPEVKSFSVSCEGEYNDEGGTYYYTSLYLLHCLTTESKKTLADKLEIDLTDEYIYSNNETEFDVSLLDETIVQEDIYNLKLFTKDGKSLYETNTFTRPEEDFELITLNIQTKLSTLLQSFLTLLNKNAI